MTLIGDPEEMAPTPSPITCEQVDREDLDTRYLRGQLEEAYAEAFEAHYFGCDRCWELVRTGNELRAARAARPPWTRRPWIWAAAAAVIGGVGIGLWPDLRQPVPSSPAAERRGGRGPLAIAASTSPEQLTVSWAGIPEAFRFRVRLYRSDGSVLLEREVADTFFAIARDSLGVLPPILHWQVHALDRLGGVLVRFPLAEVRP